MNRKRIYREQFKTHLERLGYGQSSRHMLPACVAEFLSCLQAKGLCDLRQIAPRHIQEHYEYLSQRPNKRKSGGLSSIMISHHIYAIRLFLDFLEQTRAITENPISGLIFPRPESTPREILTMQEIKRLYAVAESYREKAIIGLYYGCGLRRTEGVNLNIKDISFKSSLLYVREGKGKKRRVVPIYETVKEDFKHYCYTERNLCTFTTTQSTNSPESPQAFILNHKGHRMGAGTCNKTIKELVKKAGIEKDISLHSLRHSIATHLLNNGLSLEYVRDFLGHKHLESTQLYTRITNQQIFKLC